MLTNPPKISRLNVSVETDFPYKNEDEDSFEVPVKLNPHWTLYRFSPRLLFKGYRRNGERLPLRHRSSSKTVSIEQNFADTADFRGDVVVEDLRQPEGIAFLIDGDVDYGEEIMIQVTCVNTGGYWGEWCDDLFITMPPRPLKPLRMSNELRQLRTDFGAVLGELLGILGGTAANPLLK